MFPIILSSCFFESANRIYPYVHPERCADGSREGRQAVRRDLEEDENGAVIPLPPLYVSWGMHMDGGK